MATAERPTERVNGMFAVLLLAACSAPTTAPPATQAPPPETFAPIITDDPLVGTGIITFGTAYDPDTLLVNPSKSSFKASTKEIAWSASLSEPAGATSLTWILAKRSASGVESTLFKQDTDVSNPDFDLLANAVDLALLVDRKPGTYVMRYLRESEVLAEGEFTLVR